MPLLQTLREKGFGMDFKGGFSIQRVVFVADAFVGDTDLIETAKYTWDEFKDIVIQMQWALNLWSTMIHAVGGALVP